MTKPTLAVRNAIAFVDVFGSFASHTRISTRLAARKYDADRGYVWVYFNHQCDPTNTRAFYLVTDEGREVAAKGTLAKALAWLKAEGFKTPSCQQRNTKPNYIPGFTHDDGRSAWIGSGRDVYVCAKDGGRSVLQFEAKEG